MRKLIIGNWKLNPRTLAEAKKLALRIDPRPRHKTVICPPTAFLGQIDYPNLGAQDCFWETSGTFTGQTSAVQLKSLKVKYCLAGHSERRNLGETDEQVNAKVKALLAVGITPVLCVGYGTTVEQDDLEVVDILRRQLDADLAGAEASEVVVAYEPVWAISSGDPYATKKIATPEHAEKIALFIKSRFGVKIVIYGGSANIKNARGFLEQPNIDGLLPGAASLIPPHFNEIINTEL